MLHPQNPFGAAKPREAVLANRSGKTESEILQEEVAKEKLKVLLTADWCICVRLCVLQCMYCARACS